MGVLSMSSGWDFNGDGKSDYVDYKIFNTQINPYSGEYEGYHFATISRRKLSYRLCVIVICVFSAFVSNLGLDTIISVAAPILGLVYPPVLVLHAVSLLMPHMSNSICISAVLGALVMSVLSTADSLGLPLPWLHRMPLANVDMAWILPSVLCGVAAFLYRLPWLERAED